MLKGETIIELTDVKSGKVEVHKDTNMVTNALTDIINMPMKMMRYYNAYESDDKFFPVISKLIGGVVLFPDTLEEDADSYYAPYNVDATGFAGAVVNSGTNKRRGSRNENETERITDDQGHPIGYKFVWDFATSQANGDIACVCLTHPTAGYNWYGCDDGTGRNVLISEFSEDTTSQSVQLSNSRPCVVGTWRYMDPDTGCIYSVQNRSDGKGWDFYKSNMVNGVSPVKLFDNRTAWDRATKDSNNYRYAFTAPLPEKADTSEFWNLVNNGGSVGICPWKKDWLYLVCCTGNSSGTAKVAWAKINMKTGEWTEGLWSAVSAFLSAPADRMVANGDYVYILSNNKKGFYKININNPADVSLIAAPDGFTLADALINKLPNGVIIGSNYYMANDVIWKCANGRVGVTDTNHAAVGNGPYMIGGSFDNSKISYSSNYRDNITRRLILCPQYLATINNLSQPVTKTADKTMKITYTITETE